MGGGWGEFNWIAWISGKLLPKDPPRFKLSQFYHRFCMIVRPAARSIYNEHSCATPQLLSLRPLKILLCVKEKLDPEFLYDIAAIVQIAEHALNTKILNSVYSTCITSFKFTVRTSCSASEFHSLRQLPHDITAIAFSLELPPKKTRFAF